MEKIKKIAEIRNWIGKFFLLFLGIVMLTGVFYKDIRFMFMLDDIEPPSWTTTHKWFILIGSAFVIGGVFLNNILDGVSAGFKNFANKFSK